MCTPPMRGHTQHPLPPEIKMQHHVCSAFAQGSPLRLSLGLFFVFYWRLVTQAPSAYHVAEVQTSRRKVGVRIKDDVCIRSRHSKNSYQLGSIKYPPPPKSKLPDTSQGPRLQTGLSEGSSLRTAMFLCLQRIVGGNLRYYHRQY